MKSMSHIISTSLQQYAMGEFQIIKYILASDLSRNWTVVSFILTLLYRVHRLKFLLLNGLIAVLLFGSNSASALNGRNIEIQIETATIADLIRREFVNTDVCPVSIPCSLADGDCFLDHVEIPGPGTFRRGPDTIDVSLGDGTVIPGVQPVQLVQPIDVFIKTAACVGDPNCAPHDYHAVSQIDAILEFNVSTDPEGQQQICSTLIGTEPDLGLAESLPNLDVCSDLPTNSFDNLVRNLSLTRQGVSLSTRENRLAVRFEYESGPANTSEWENFLSGNIAIEPTNSQFAVIFGRTLLQDIFKGFIDPNQIDTVNKDGPQKVRWLPLGSALLAINVTTPVEAIVPACPDIDLDIKTSFLLNFDPLKDELVIDASFDIDLNDGDMAACVFLALGWAGPEIMSIAVPVLTAIAHGLLPDSDEFLQQSDNFSDKCLATGEQSFTCRFPVNLKPMRFSKLGGPLLNLNFQGQMATQNSYSLVGNTEVMGIVNSPYMAHTGSDVKFHVGHNCNSVSAGYSGWISFYGHAAICEVDLREDLDPYNVYEVTQTIMNDYLPANFAVQLNDVGERFWNNPYDFAMTIQTTAGARTVSVKAPTKVSDAQQDTAILAVKGKMSADCANLQIGWLGDPGAYNPLWDIDPPPFLRVVDHIIKPTDNFTRKHQNDYGIEHKIVSEKDLFKRTFEALRKPKVSVAKEEIVEESRLNSGHDLRNDTQYQNNIMSPKKMAFSPK